MNAPRGRHAPAQPTRILLVRHAQSAWNVLGRWQGQADPPLSALGERQAHHAGRATELATLGAVATSDLVRASRTAELMTVGRAEPSGDARWRERHVGAWQGLTRDEIEAGWPGFLSASDRPHDWEHDDAVYARVTEAISDLATRVEGGVALAVTHGGVIGVVERRLGASNARVPNLGGRWLVVEAGGTTLGDRVVLVDESELTIPGQI